MICIKSIKSLTEREKEEFHKIFFQPLDGELIVFDKSNNSDEIYGFLTAKKAKDYNIISQFFVHEHHRNQGIGKKLLENVKKIIKNLLIICLRKESSLIFYFMKREFKLYNQHEDYVIMGK